MTYSVVNVRDERSQVLSIIHTSTDGGQQVIALQVTPGYADKIVGFLNLVDQNGAGYFDERQRQQIEFCRLYAQRFGHGAPGHLDMMIIARFAELLGL